MHTTICQINGNRLFDRVLKLSEIGKIGQKGVQRFALSQEDKEAQRLVGYWMKEAGMEVRLDNFGNLIGRKNGKNPNLPVVMIGSHIDTVPNGGRFDGTIGVIGGIEIVHAINEANISHEHPIEVVAFCEEEGSRFMSGFFGSKGMVGKISADDLVKKDEQGTSRYQALKSLGADPDKIEDSIRNPEEIKLYLEMHIEQGPYLEANDFPVGVVKGIAGFTWFKISIKGEAGHAGTVPMNLRKDPMIGAAEIIKEIESICKEDPTGTMVGTVGKIAVVPGGSNVIPESVEFMLDLRDIDLERRNKTIKKIKTKVNEICQRRHLEYCIEKRVDIPPVQCSEQVIQALKKSSKKLNIDAPTMISGAGHDAMLMAEITQMGLVFVRCRNGISHNPDEWANKEDISRE